jgi:hypothetical protein
MLEPVGEGDDAKALGRNGAAAVPPADGGRDVDEG